MPDTKEDDIILLRGAETCRECEKESLHMAELTFEELENLMQDCLDELIRRATGGPV
jgi:uncharacterized protein YceH (UPF0502 family)